MWEEKRKEQERKTVCSVAWNYEARSIGVGRKGEGRRRGDFKEASKSVEEE